jgi:LacI family fructose operon transcriptional repressor
LPASELRSVVVGSFDWDPFAAHLPFDVTMMRQNVEAMVAEGFTLIDDYESNRDTLIVVPTSFGKMGDLDGAQEDWHETTKPAAKKSPRRARKPTPLADGKALAKSI